MASQTDIYNQLQSVLGGGEPPPFEENTSQVENLSFIEFIFEILKQTSGQDKFKNVVFNSVLADLKNSTDIDNIIIDSFRNYLFCEIDFIIPDDLTTNTVNGVSIQTNEIDAFNLFQIEPESDTGSLLYEGNDSEKHLNYLLKKSLEATSDDPLNWSYQNTVLFNVYNNGNELFFRFGSSYSGENFINWAEDFFASIQIFNPVNFLTLLTDILTGSVSIKSNKNRIQIGEESRIIQAFKKLFGFCSNENNNDSDIQSSPQDTIRNNNAGNNSNEPDNFPLNFNSNDLNDIEEEKRLKSNNLLQFKTCGDLELPLNSDKVVNDLQNIFNNFNINSSTIDNENVSVNVDDASNFVDNTIKNGINNKKNKNEDGGESDLQNIQAEVQVNLLKAIPYSLMQMVISPKLLLFGKISNVIQNNNENEISLDDFIKKLVNVIGDVGAKLSKLILNNVFEFLKKELEKLVDFLKNRFLTQRLLDYASILEFLKSLINTLAPDNNNCSSILNTILKILSLANFSPATPIPPPLVLSAVPLKPGMNEVTAINDMKAEMASKGLNTDNTYNDGTPNYMMFALESAVSAVIKNIKQYSKIDVTTIGPTGPTQGSGQIQ